MVDTEGRATVCAGLDPAEFAPIALGLQRFTASEIARHLGVSVSIASKYRRGLAVPHVRHWAALAELAGVTLPASVPAQ